jgi:hypothetical protein
MGLAIRLRSVEIDPEDLLPLLLERVHSDRDQTWGAGRWPKPAHRHATAPTMPGWMPNPTHPTSLMSDASGSHDLYG